MGHPPMKPRALRAQPPAGVAPTTDAGWKDARDGWIFPSGFGVDDVQRKRNFNELFYLSHGLSFVYLFRIIEEARRC